MSRPLARQNESIAAQQAYRRVSKICASVEALITEHGEAGVASLRQYAGDNDTVKASILGIVRRRLPGAMAVAREALCV